MEKSSNKKKIDISKANQVFKDNMSQIRTIAEWADQMGYKDQKYFAVKYRNYYGQKCKQAMVSIRTNMAKELLIKDGSVKHYEVAQRIGLKDEVSLYKYFIRHEGKSPSSFRKKRIVKKDSKKR